MRSWAYLALLFNALVWGLSWLPLRHLQEAGLHPVWATMLFFALGALMTGLSVWVRPDGLTLLGPLVLAVLLNEKDTPTRLRSLLRVLIGFGGVFLFYLFFNLLIGGTPMPNTFYAKQAEYTLLK